MTTIGDILEKPRTHKEPRFIIKERGWQLVTRFRNPNSGNIVNVFHFTNALRTAKIRNVDMRPCNQGKGSD